MEKRFITIKELCEYTGWCAKKVREIVKRDKSPFTVKCGNRYYIDKEKFDAYIEQCIRYGLPV